MRSAGAKGTRRTDMLLMAKGWARAGALAVAAVLLVSASQAQAQQPPPPPRQQAKPAPPVARDLPPGSDAALQRRVEQLEEQFVDLQVMIGTLESLARGAAAPSGGPRSGPGVSAAVNAADAGRMDAIETQIRALAAQLESLQDQVRALGGRTGLNVPNSEPPPAGFGSVTVAPEAPQDDIDRLLTSPRGGPPPRVAVSPPPGDSRRDGTAAAAALRAGLRLSPAEGLQRGGIGFRRLPEAPPHPPARRQRTILARRDFLRARSVPGGCRSLPEGVSNLLQKSEGARVPAEAGHVAAAAGAEGCRLLLLQRARDEISQSARAREKHRAGGAPAQRLRCLIDLCRRPQIGMCGPFVP